MFCYLLSTAYFTFCLFCFCFSSFLISHFPPLREIFVFQYTFVFLWLSLDSRIFAKHLFVVPYEINSSLLIATTKREHLFLNKVEVEFNASEETHWNVSAEKLVMRTRVVLPYHFIVLLIFCYLLSTVYFVCWVVTFVPFYICPFAYKVVLFLRLILPTNCEKSASRIPKEIQYVRILYKHVSGIPLFAPKSIIKSNFFDPLYFIIRLKKVNENLVVLPKFTLS